VTRTLAGSALLLWAGAALLLSQLRWFSRRPLTARLRPYEPGGLVADPHGASDRSTLRELVSPLVHHAAASLTGMIGVREDVDARLERIHAPLDATAFRMRQMGWAAAGFGIGSLLVVATRPPLAIAALFALGGPILAFLVVEQQLASASDRRKRRIFLELPVLAEQLGMLLGAGYSVGGALNRVASRGHGACAEDLARVVGRMRQGLSELDALREWAAVADVDALHRLVAVLALNREAGDLSRLVGAEARSIRRDVQRELIEQIERRAQQVWIPVTVAALVPGAVLLAVPFIEALRLFSTS
jgi:tight adherence protein C